MVNENDEKCNVYMCHEDVEAWTKTHETTDLPDDYIMLDLAIADQDSKSQLVKIYALLFTSR